MSALGFHAAASAWLAALAVPLVLVYFLKLRRPRLELPSLVLWRQVMNDRRVNAPFQRFRRDLLLWLQLLALALLVAAAMQPFIHGAAQRTDRLPVLIDVSASMGARAAAGGPTRLDEAKRKIQALIDDLGPDQQLCLIAMGRDARRLTGFSDDRRELSQALAALTVDEVAAAPAAALQLAQAMGRGTPFERALLVSDGNLPELVDADLAFHLDYQRVPAGGDNLGITACGAQRRSDGGWAVFAAVEASAHATGSATLELVQGGQVLASRPVAPGPAGVERVAFRVDGGAASELELRLVCDGFDALASDDRAFLALPALRPVRAAVAPGLGAWRRALAAQADVVLVDGPATPAELVVSDRADDLARPALVRLSVGLVPPELTGEIAVQDQGGSAVVDARAGEPLLAHVALGDLLVAERVAWAPGAGEKDLEAKGFTVLVHGDRGPLLLRRARSGSGSGDDYHLLFHSDHSTLPYRLAFPVLAGNLVAQALHAGGQDEVAGVPTGLLPALPAAPGRAVEMVRPDGTVATALADRQGLVAGIGAPHPGFYRLRGGGDAVVGVALLDSRETGLGAVERLQVREVAVAAVATAPSEHGLWRQLALVAFLVALLEWWYGHRRPLAGARP
jgi:hypothetical protein